MAFGVFGVCAWVAGPDWVRGASHTLPNANILANSITNTRMSVYSSPYRARKGDGVHSQGNLVGNEWEKVIKRMQRLLPGSLRWKFLHDLLIRLCGAEEIRGCHMADITHRVVVRRRVQPPEGGG